MIGLLKAFGIPDWQICLSLLSLLSLCSPLVTLFVRGVSLAILFVLLMEGEDWIAYHITS